MTETITKPIELTEKLVNELLDAAVAERGEDFIYSDEHGGRLQCKYVHAEDTPDASPGCLVGLVLHKAGVPLDAFTHVEDTDASNALRHFAEEGLLRIEGPAGYILNRAQSQQDCGQTWGMAVEKARTALDDAREDGRFV